MDKRESVAFIKVLLGVLAAFIGIPLLLAGLFVYAVASTVDPEIAGGGQTEGWIQIGFLTASVGALLCFAAWVLLRSEAKSTTQSGAGPREEQRLCSNCGCRVADGSKTCEWCGADVKQAERRRQSWTRL